MRPSTPRILAALLCLVCPWFATAAGADGEAFAVHGEVTADGRPLAGAEVRLLPVAAETAAVEEGEAEPAPAVARTGDDGRYTLPLPSPGPWSIEATAPERLTMRTVVEALDADLHLDAVVLPPVRPLRLQLTAGGGPVAAAALAWPATEAPAERFGDWRPRTNRAESDEAGTATLAVAAAGSAAAGLGGAEVEIRLDLDGRPPRRLTVPASPGPHAVALETATISAFETAEPPAAPLTGRVVDAATGRPLAGALVWSRPPAAVRLARTAADGSFTLQPGDGPPPRALAAVATGHRPARVERAGDRRLEIALTPHRRGHGWVVDGDDRPIEGAEVRLAGGPDGELPLTLGPFRTAADGRYEVPDPPPGRYRLSVRAEGFGPVTVPGLEVAEGPTTGLGTVTLFSGVSLAGRVVDDAGRPLPGARVALADDGPLPWPVVQAQGEVKGRAVSDDDGRFTVADLEPGERVRLRVEKEGFETAEPAPLTLPAEQPVEVVLAAPAVLSGWVVDAAGQAIPSALVSAVGERGETRSTRGDGGGSFEFAGVAAGRWALHAAAEGYRDGGLDGVVVEPGDAAGGLEIVLAPGAALTGRVIEADGTAAVGAHVELTVGSGEASHDTVADAAGRFRFAGLDPGSYRLAAIGGTGRRAGQRVEVAAGSADVLLVLDAGAAVAGTVLRDDGSPVAAASVVLLRTGGDGGSTRTTTDAEGRFAWAAVPDGRHDLLVSADGLAPSPLLAVEVDGSPVSGIEVVLGGGVTLHGRVSGVEVRDLSRVVVRSTDASGSRVTGVGPEGGFVLPNLPNGEVRLTVELTGTGRRHAERVALPAGAREVEIEVALP